MKHALKTNSGKFIKVKKRIERRIRIQSNLKKKKHSMNTRWEGLQ